jgi:hypothetical protein
MIFYTLHELFNVLEVNTNEGITEHGKRNCKLFLLGTLLWIIVFVLAWNFKLGYFGPMKIWTDSVIYGLWVLLFADLFVMAYIYKSYFGRSVLWEVNEKDSELFEYNEKKHSYKRKKPTNIEKEPEPEPEQSNPKLNVGNQ